MVHYMYDIMPMGFGDQEMSKYLDVSVRNI